MQRVVLNPNRMGDTLSEGHIPIVLAVLPSSALITEIIGFVERAVLARSSH